MHRHIGLSLALFLALSLPNGPVFATEAASTWPLPLEMPVQFEPTAFPSAGRTYLTYELYLRNFGTTPLTLRRIEVLDADARAAEPIAAFEAEQLDTLLQPVGVQTPADGSSDRRQLPAGDSVVVFLWIALDHGAHIPKKLRHRVLTADAAADGAVIGTHQPSCTSLARRWKERIGLHPTARVMTRTTITGAESSSSMVAR
jgi:hypothetical protein